MKRAVKYGLPSLLLILVASTHIGYDVIASFYPDHVKAAKAWFYILRGFEGTFLYLIVWALTPWKPISVRLATSLVCAWGAAEELQTAIWRLGYGIENFPEPSAFKGLGEMVTGWPIYMLSLLAVLVIFAHSRKG